MLPKPERLTRRRDFAAVYARKKSWANDLLALYVRRQNGDSANAETRRFGFSVSKKIGKAHDRNGVKRRLREICRKVGQDRPDGTETWRQGFDAVFVARTGVATTPYVQLEAAVRELARRAGLLIPVVPATDASAGVSERHTLRKGMDAAA